MIVYHIMHQKKKKTAKNTCGCLHNDYKNHMNRLPLDTWFAIRTKLIKRTQPKNLMYFEHWYSYCFYDRIRQYNIRWLKDKLYDKTCFVLESHDRLLKQLIRFIKILTLKLYVYTLMGIIDLSYIWNVIIEWIITIHCHWFEVHINRYNLFIIIW